MSLVGRDSPVGRAPLTQFRASTRLLNIETGHWSGIQAVERVCVACRSGDIEVEGCLFSLCLSWDESCAWLYIGLLKPPV